MKPVNIYLRLLTFFAIPLCICNPVFQASAAVASAPLERSTESNFSGTFENGMQFAFVSSPKMKDGKWIQLTCSISEEEAGSPVALLTQHAFFYGTSRHTRPEMIEKLSSFGFDVDPNSFLSAHDHARSIQLSLSSNADQEAQEVLAFLNELVFSPALGHDEIEIARQHLLQNIDQSTQDRSTLEAITASDVRSFHRKWYSPEHMHLTIASSDNLEKLISIAGESFGTRTAYYEETPLPSKGDELVNHQRFSPALESVEWTAEGQYMVVDGKIWMKEPNWINQSSNGRTLGAILTVLGVGGMILTFPITAPLAIVAGGLSTGAGLYFLTADYLKDPHFIESARKSDLKDGCAYAYKKGRAGITLTPYERRAVFLQEMVDRPQSLFKSPILLLADLYQLNDPIVAEIFTVDEFNVITNLKRDFIQHRNQYKTLIENLERELAYLTAPYAAARDASLLQAQDLYHQNYFVVAKETLKLQRDASIDSIKQAFTDHEITMDERESMIDQAYAYYDACLETPDFKAGLNAAEMNLAQAELEIQTTYNYQVELAKQTLQYNQWMAYYKNGEKSLIEYFDRQLHDLLATFPVYWTIFPDFLDLRGL